MSGFTIKTGNDILGPGGLEVDMALATPEQSKLAFERAARDAKTDDERIELGYRYLAEMLRGPEPVEDEEEEVVTKTVKKKAPAKAQAKETPVANAPATGVTEALLAKLVDKLDKLTAQTEAEVEIEREPASEPEPVKTQAATFSQDDVLKALRTGFDTLGIPDLGPEPEKPQHKVTFDLGLAGKITSWYHWVSQQDQGLFLVYDTRFEYGTVYEPPNLGKDTVIRVTHSSGNEYYVHSLGFTNNFGVFSIVNLVLANKPQIVDMSESEMVRYD